MQVAFIDIILAELMHTALECDVIRYELDKVKYFEKNQ